MVYSQLLWCGDHSEKSVKKITKIKIQINVKYGLVLFIYQYGIAVFQVMCIFLLPNKENVLI